jgi:uncharacterized protein involved in exopolysaccharide biosynthesis
LNGLVETGDQGGNRTGPDLPLMFVRGVVRSFPWMLMLISLGAAVGIGVGLLQHNRYVSNAKLCLRLGAREELNSESLVEFDDPRRVPPQAGVDDMADELQMLSEVAIFERVAGELGPRVVSEPADPECDDGPLTPATVRLLHRVQGFIFRRMAAFAPAPVEDELRSSTKILWENTTVRAEPRSRVVLLSSTSTSPEKARTIVQALANAFIERHRKQFSIQALLEKSRGQLAEARQTRDTAANAYVEQVSQSGIAVLETQVPRLETELSSFEGDLFAARVRREEISRLRTSLSNRLQGIPAEVEIQRPSVMIPNEEYETQLALKRMLLGQQQEMLIQSRPSEETRRRQKEFDNQIARVDQKLKETPKAVVQGSEMQENLGHSAMESRIADLEVEDETLLAKISLLESRVEVKKARLAELQKQLLTATMTRKDLASARDAEESRYTHLLDRFSVLEALENIDTNEGANLRVLQAPTLELEKVGPNRTSLLLKGLLFGLFAAIAFSILREKFERRLCYPETFEDARGVPVLGVVRHLAPMRDLGNHVLVGGR